VVVVVGLSVTDPTYARAVVATFGDRCGYCQRVLEADRASVEHLDGMNRFRIGLHVPGNVIVACKRCNSSKRQDDQLETLRLAENGWESFLSHDGTRCPDGCKTCSYWQMVWPDVQQRSEGLHAALRRIRTFREAYVSSGEWSKRTRAVVGNKINLLYRACQKSANEQIQTMADELFQELGANGEVTPQLPLRRPAWSSRRDRARRPIPLREGCAFPCKSGGRSCPFSRFPWRSRRPGRSR